MKRNVLFVSPYAITSKDGTQWFALINGQRKWGNHQEVTAAFDAAKKQHLADKRKAKAEAA